MTYPKELHESTYLAERNHPFQFFFNECRAAKRDQNILYLHWHEHFEIIVMRQGSAIFHIDSQPYEAFPGDVLIVPAGGLHVGYSTCEGDIAYLSIVFNSSLFQDWAHDAIHASIVLPYLEGTVHFPVKPAFLNPECANHYSLLEQASLEFIAKKPGYQLMIKSLLHMLLVQLARTFLPQQQPEGANSRYMYNRDRFKSLIRHIESNFADRLTVTGAAKHMNLNPFHFCKMFKKLTGRTFIEYVNVCKINEAERLLLDDKLSITEIASAVGCDNPNYFTRLFRQYKGVTPSQFRRQ